MEFEWPFKKIYGHFFPMNGTKVQAFFLFKHFSKKFENYIFALLLKYQLAPVGQKVFHHSIWSFVTHLRYHFR